MQLAEYSVPKMNSALAEEDGIDGGLFFCSLFEGVSGFAGRFPAAKMLVVSDKSSYRAVSALPKNPRFVFLVLDSEDCLPLFSMPDGVSCAVAVGEPRTLRSLRYFAEVRGIPCALFPVHGSLSGAFEIQGDILCGGVRTRAKLGTGEVYCDSELLNGAGGYASLLLGRLALFEARVLRSFRFACGNQRAEEEVYPLLSPLPARPEKAEIVRLNARLREAERRGAYAGEGIKLAEALRTEGAPDPEWNAFAQLSALYYCFFAYGRPRRYVLPDYSMRAAQAGADYLAQSVPSEAEFASRALALETMRGAYLAEITSLRKRKSEYLRTYISLGGSSARADTSALRRLPEAGGGLSVLVRDFGLMEW